MRFHRTKGKLAFYLCALQNFPGSDLSECVYYVIQHLQTLLLSSIRPARAIHDNRANCLVTRPIQRE